MYQKEYHGLNIVELEITNTCNLNCKHCYVKKEKKRFMSYNTAKEIIKQCIEMEVYRLVFTGGEPLLHEDLISLAKYAKNKIPSVVLFTNGLLINESNINEMLIFDHIQISIDVPPTEKGQFRINYSDKIEEKVKLLTSKKIVVHLHATLHRSLLPYISDLIKYANNHLGVRIGFNKLVSMDNKELKKECLTPLELKSALSEISYWMNKKGYDVSCSDPLLFLVNKKKMQYFKSIKKYGIKGGCTAGIASLYINAEGDVYPCPFIPVLVGNIKNIPLKKLWYKNPIFNQLRMRRNYDGKCGKCKFVDFCGGCRAVSFYNFKNLTNSDSDCFYKGV